MRNSASRLVCGALIIGLLAMLVAAGLVMSAASRANEQPFQEAAKRIEPLHREKSPPGPSDWLASHDEPGQTFAQYVRSRPNRPTAKRTTLYVQPIGAFSPAEHELVDQTAELLSRFYGLPTKVLDPLGLEVIPPEARRVHPTWGDRQILSTYVLDEVLKPRRPPDAVAVLGLTTADLWPGEGWNFVFGQASLRERVGVWSLARYGDAEAGEAESRRFRRRMFKVALHETGHMLGIAHCTFYECGMNGSNHLAEMDSRPLWFCPVDERKIWWACGADPVNRYESLIDFARKHGLHEEAEFWRASLDRLTREARED